MALTKCLPFILLSSVALLLTACDPKPQQWKKPNMIALSPRLQPIFKKTRTVCFGRFMVDVPASTTVVWGGVDIPLGVNVYPNGVEEVNGLAQKLINELKSEKAIYLNDIPLLISVENLKDPDGQIVTGYDGFEAIGALKINGYFKLNDDGVIIDARPLKDRRESATARIKSMARRLRLRAENEIPTEPGNCIEYAFLPDEPGPPKEPPAELLSIGFRLKEFPDVHLSIQIRPSNPHYSESDSLEWQLERLEKDLKAEDPNHPMLKTVYFRRGPRQIHDWVNGFEGLSRSPEQSTVHSVHDFAIAFRGVAGNYLKPFADIRMQTGVANNAIGATKASLTDEEAIAVWDKITSTIRLRPTGTTTVKATDAGPRLPLGELAATGRICPQTGWWESDEPAARQDDRRQHIKAGERMPHVVSLGEPSLWQKIKGVYPSYRTATVWKLVGYGDPPAPAHLAAETPTDKKG
ncbi:T6SS immunity protein Tli4 family protein [Massilia sp. 2TAF26]|uniref:T6SS immunity protein Tli4 family protein n=1 Tax=Massilia sp. 2TAF26 TaxID=3233012 RepID=UPI003F9E4735